MSQHDLKTSLRHTHAYLKAYDMALLQAIERAFKQDRAAEVRESGDDEKIEPVLERPPATSAPDISPQQYAPQRDRGDTCSPAAADGLSNWHLYMPALLAAVVIIALLVRP